MRRTRRRPGEQESSVVVMTTVAPAIKPSPGKRKLRSPLGKQLNAGVPFASEQPDISPKKRVVGGSADSNSNDGILDGRTLQAPPMWGSNTDALRFSHSHGSGSCGRSALPPTPLFRRDDTYSSCTPPEKGPLHFGTFPDSLPPITSSAMDVGEDGPVGWRGGMLSSRRDSAGDAADGSDGDEGSLRQSLMDECSAMDTSASSYLAEAPEEWNKSERGLASVDTAVSPIAFAGSPSQSYGQRGRIRTSSSPLMDDIDDQEMAGSHSFSPDGIVGASRLEAMRSGSRGNSSGTLESIASNGVERGAADDENDGFDINDGEEDLDEGVRGGGGQLAYPFEGGVDAITARLLFSPWSSGGSGCSTPRSDVTRTRRPRNSSSIRGCDSDVSPAVVGDGGGSSSSIGEHRSSPPLPEIAPNSTPAVSNGRGVSSLTCQTATPAAGNRLRRTEGRFGVAGWEGNGLPPPPSTGGFGTGIKRPPPAPTPSPADFQNGGSSEYWTPHPPPLGSGGRTSPLSGSGFQRPQSRRTSNASTVTIPATPDPSDTTLDASFSGFKGLNSSTVTVPFRGGIGAGGRGGGSSHAGGGGVLQTPLKPPAACPPTPERPQPWEGHSPTAHIGMGGGGAALSRRSSLKDSKVLAGGATEPVKFTEDFTDIRTIGEGNFARVMRAVWKKNNQVYAIKMSKRKFKGDKDRANYLQEATTLQKLNSCPYVVHFEGAWQEDGFFYVQTELCELGNLKDLTQALRAEAVDGILPDSFCWKIAHDAAEGLHYIHMHDIVHLDIKPSNIFLSSEGNFKIGDFGMATAVSTADSEGHEGDRCYMAPELFGNAWSTPADMFSLGVTLHEVASGLTPPANDELWHQMRQNRAPPLPDHCGADLAEMIKALLSQAAEDRPTADALRLHYRVKVALSLDVALMRTAQRMAQAEEASGSLGRSASYDAMQAASSLGAGDTTPTQRYSSPAYMWPRG